ncbi:TetR/AcrR family transcriptional regulator [Lentzea sp. NPDC058436]|uniref:TetR/AcrR family transcriptional regulator n=1 Tax=Lentzea sp. NPDC058436 TaxID=3346499 RepID=UPI00364DD02C
MSTSAMTEKGRRTRQRIIDATAEQILAAGIGGTTLETVRAATLTSKSQLFHYFPGGKTELIREVARWEWEQLLAAQEKEIGDLSTWESWHRWRDGLRRYYLDEGRWACPIGALATEAAAADPETAAFMASAGAQWRDALTAGVRRMRDAGHLSPDADVNAISGAVAALIHGGIMLSQPSRSPDPLVAALDQVLSPLVAAA